MSSRRSVDPLRHHRAGLRRPRDGSVFERASPALRRAADVADGVAETPRLPAVLRPQVADLAVDLVRAEVGPPVDGAALEVVESPVARAAPQFVGDRVAEEAAVPTAPRPLH